MNRAASRRGLIIAALVLLFLLVAADLMRTDSTLRRLFGVDPPTRQEELLDDLRRRGIPVPDRVGCVVPGARPGRPESTPA